MTNSITDRLKTSTPSLLPREEWPMSKGPVSVVPEALPDKSYRRRSFQLRDGDDNLIVNLDFTNSAYSKEAAEKLARYIAACLDESPLVEKMWRAYERLISAAEVISGEWGDGSTIHETQYASAIELLESLDAMSVIRWTPKEGE